MYRHRIVFGDLRAYILGAFIVSLLLISTQMAHAATLTFNFTLGSDATTSAGAYKPDGTLVKTLWRKVFYRSGAHSFTWDGKDDDGNNAPAGTYQFKIISHNVNYVWDGAIANTSTAASGPTVHRSFHPMRDMAISGSDAFYVAGYNEAGFALNRFNTSNPQALTAKWRWTLNGSSVQKTVGNIYDRSWSFSATDGTWAYFAAPRAWNTAANNDNGIGFVTASKVSDTSQAYFTNGTQIVVGPSGQPPLPNGIYVGTQGGLSGLAVQKTGSLLAAAVAPDNKIYFFDKTSGTASGSLTVTAPGRIEFAPNGDLWVVTGTSVVRYTLSGSPNVWTVVTTITSFADPLDVAVHPTDNNIVMVADGGSSQQIKAYNSTGTSLWTYGTAGGYATNGNTVANNKFWFNLGQPLNLDDKNDTTFISIASDGSFWVGDGGNNRTLHFSSARAYIDQIAYSPYSYVSGSDRNNPNRVFSEFLEYSVDYSQPAGTGWTLVKNWGAGLPAGYFSFWMRGLKQVVTLSNGRTYGYAYDTAVNKYRLLELNGTSTRIIGDLDQTSGYSTTINSNGDLIKAMVNGGTWTKQALTSFDGSNNPQWATATTLATASTGSKDPAPRCCGMGDIRTPITSSNVVVSYDQSMNNGYHLGGVNTGGTAWLWRAMPAVTSNVPLDGLGSYDIGDGITYAASAAVSAGRNIVAAFHGEFYQGQGQAGQFMNFYDNGLFVGQFGESGVGHNAIEGAIAGFAGNGISPELVKASNGETYLWINDENGHGPQRWHLVGANSIQEWSGSGTLGGSAVSVTPIAVGFPTNVTALGGNAVANITWTAVPGASSYNVKYSTTNGGPYTSVTGITGTSYDKTGLTNGTKYYFVVSAIVSSVESTNSSQVAATPFDTSVVVQTAGQQTPTTKLYPITSTAPANGYPAVTNISTLIGDLKLSQVGSKGYKLFNWGGAGTDNTSVLSPFTVTTGGSWTNDRYLQGDFKVDGISSSDYGLYSNPTGTIDISVSDTNFHYLTVFSTSRFGDSRAYTIKLTPQGASTPAVTYTLATENPGANHIYQFRFKGNVTLTMDSTGGAIGTVQAIFLDDQPHYTPAVPSAPTGLTATAGNTQVVLNWTATSGATSYNVYRGTTSNGQSTTAIATGVTGTTYTNTSLTNGTAYYYKIKAVNSAGTSAYSNEASATPVATPAAPTGLTATAGNAQIVLNWAATSGATSYNVYRGTTSNGQSSTAIATGITATTYTNTSLNNGTAYYYKIKAVNAGGTSAYSNEAFTTPRYIVTAGHYVAPLDDVSVVYSVSNTAPSSGLPALTGLSGLTLNSVGTKGYIVYNWGGAGSHNSNVLSPFTIGTPSGFSDNTWLKNQFTIGGTTGSTYGLYSNPSGSINVSVSDSAVHTLTVISSPRFNDARSFVIKVTPQGSSSPAASYTVSEAPGKNHIFQFQFTGNVTLNVTTPTDWQQVGVVHALFLD